jgi:hypothetical protein
MNNIEVGHELLQRVNFIPYPFPHIIIDDFYNEHEYNMILKELDFLFVEGKLLPPGKHHAPSLTTTTHKALMLELAYAMPEISNILYYSKKTTDINLVNLIISQFDSFKQLKAINKWITKVRYYFDGEGYLPHTDIPWSFLTFWYHYKEPKKYSGGELYFTEYDNYTIECNNNRLIIVPSYPTHAVNPVNVSNEDYWSGLGRFCISQFLSVEYKH